jgi:hypothetical protein
MPWVDAHSPEGIKAQADFIVKGIMEALLKSPPNWRHIFRGGGE